jgi:hypothetical protein
MRQTIIVVYFVTVSFVDIQTFCIMSITPFIVYSLFFIRLNKNNRHLWFKSETVSRSTMVRGVKNRPSRTYYVSLWLFYWKILVVKCDTDEQVLSWTRLEILITVTKFTICSWNFVVLSIHSDVSFLSSIVNDI